MWGVGVVVPMAAGGHGSSCLHRIMPFRSPVFCKGLRYGRGLGSGCWLLLESAIGPRCAYRGEGVVGRRGGRGADCRGGHWSMRLHCIVFFCSAVFCRGLSRGMGVGSGCRLLLGSAIGPRCACRVEAGAGRGGRGASGRKGAWVLVPSPHHVFSHCCLLQGPQ